MEKAQRERERRHQAHLARIEAVQLVVGRGDQARIDHEGTLLERARLFEMELRSYRSTEEGLAAFERLLRRAEEPYSPHASGIASFLSAVSGDRPLVVRDLRSFDTETGDDMLAVLDAVRHARLTLADHVAGGPRRVRKLIEGKAGAEA